MQHHSMAHNDSLRDLHGISPQLVIVFLPFPLTFRQEHFCFSEGSITPFGRKQIPSELSVSGSCVQRSDRATAVSQVATSAQTTWMQGYEHIVSISNPSEIDNCTELSSLNVHERQTSHDVAFCSFCSPGEIAFWGSYFSTWKANKQAISEDQS